MPTIAVGTPVNRQAALAIMLTPRKIFFGLRTRSITVLRLACLATTRRLMIGAGPFPMRLFAREYIIHAGKSSSPAANSAFCFDHDERFLLPMAPSSNAANNSYRPSSITRETFYISDAIPRTALSAIQPTTIIANRSEIATERLPCKASPQTTITKRRLPSSTTSPASAGVPSLCNCPLFPSWACSAACCRRQS